MVIVEDEDRMVNNFKIHCIALCKNEADVIGPCLQDAAKWADYIYVYDGGSTDGTWQVVKELSGIYPGIVPWKQDGKVFKEGLRAEAFAAFRSQSARGDWWFQLNVDEFYPDNPREFLARVPQGDNFVWGKMVEYVLTEKDLAELDFSRPFEEIMPRLRYYYSSWSEPRAFRFRPRLVWSDDCAWPNHVGVVAQERILYKHYPCRSPKQIQMRMQVRQDNRVRGFRGWQTAAEGWRAGIKSSKDFLYDDGIAPLQINESSLPKHLEKGPLRLMKKFLHVSGIWP